MTFIQVLLAIVLAPLLLGVINQTKAFYGGRTGQPFLQLYWDLWKLCHKGAVYSRVTTWVFRAGPLLGLALMVCVIPLIPQGGGRSLVGFEGDFLLLAYFLGLMRLFTVLAALDTGSSFEGMGASREVQFSAVAEPALILALGALSRKAGSLSLQSMFSVVSFSAWRDSGVILGLIAASLLVVALAENSRIPVDDPNTHLELTMIHEVMVLDHSGPDLAAILYGAALKLWVLGSLFVGLVLPIRSGNILLNQLGFVGGMLAFGVMIGAIESSMARLRLLNVPRLLVGAGALSVLALLLVVR